MMPPINNNNVSEFGFIIRKCQSLVKFSCNNSHVEFSKREVNEVALSSLILINVVFGN